MMTSSIDIPQNFIFAAVQVQATSTRTDTCKISTTTRHPPCNLVAEKLWQIQQKVALLC